MSHPLVSSAGSAIFLKLPQTFRMKKQTKAALLDCPHLILFTFSKLWVREQGLPTTNLMVSWTSDHPKKPCHQADRVNDTLAWTFFSVSSCLPDPLLWLWGQWFLPSFAFQPSVSSQLVITSEQLFQEKPIVPALPDHLFPVIFSCRERRKTIEKSQEPLLHFTIVGYYNHVLDLR